MIAEEAWRYELLLARDVITARERNVLAERARRGDLVRIARGAYLPAERWAAFDAAGRYRAKVRAVAATVASDDVFSHASAAVLWELPWIGRWPDEVHVLGEVATGGRSVGVIRRHGVGVPPDFATIDGLRVTSLARTVIDLARTADFGRGVVVADAALHRTGAGAISHADLEQELASVPLRHGAARARQVAAFADGRADSPGESLSRTTMARVGVPAAVLQQEFPREGGGKWAVDFWWPEQRIVGEFDGRGKYLDPALASGRTAAEIVYAEKLREDELRRQVDGFARWDWSTARSPADLARRLRQAGLRW